LEVRRKVRAVDPGDSKEDCPGHDYEAGRICPASKAPAESALSCNCASPPLLHGIVQRKPRSFRRAGYEYRLELWQNHRGVLPYDYCIERNCPPEEGRSIDILCYRQSGNVAFSGPVMNRKSTSVMMSPKVT
jgi:hypothetical protein